MPWTGRCASDPMVDGALVNFELFGKRRRSEVQNEACEFGFPSSPDPRGRLIQVSLLVERMYLGVARRSPREHYCS